MALEKLRKTLEGRKTIILKEPLIRKIGALPGFRSQEMIPIELYNKIQAFIDNLKELDRLTIGLSYAIDELKESAEDALATAQAFNRKDEEETFKDALALVGMIEEEKRRIRDSIGELYRLLARKQIIR